TCINTNRPLPFQPCLRMRFPCLSCWRAQPKSCAGVMVFVWLVLGWMARQISKFTRRSCQNLRCGFGLGGGWVCRALELGEDVEDGLPLAVEYCGADGIVFGV